MASACLLLYFIHVHPWKSESRESNCSWPRYLVVASTVLTTELLTSLSRFLSILVHYIHTDVMHRCAT